jgi:hypothetical protein
VKPEGGRFWERYPVAVLLLFLVLAYTYVWVIQPGYGPDEPRHFAYVKRLVERHELPLLVNGREEDGAHTLHPPLYYLLMTPVYAATRGLGDAGSIRAIKHVSPLLQLAALLLFLATLRRLFPDRPFAVAAGLTVVALLPEYQLEASVMNNDGLAVLLGSLWLWYLVRTWDEPPNVRTAVIAGLIMAAFVNTKATGWTLSPLWLFALHFRARDDRPRRMGYVRDLFIGYAVLLLLGTWWYVRNYQLYGAPVPLDFMGGRLHPHSSRTGQELTPIEVYTSGEIVPLGWRAMVGLFQSFWSQIDWIDEDLRPFVYGVAVVLVGAAVAGAFVGRRHADSADVPAEGGKAGLPAMPARTRAWAAGVLGLGPAQRRFALLGIPACGFLLNWFHTWYIATFVHLGFYQGGRYIMPSVFSAGSLLAAGWQQLVPARARIPSILVLAALLLALNGACLWELIEVLNPRYVTP